MTVCWNERRGLGGGGGGGLRRGDAAPYIKLLCDAAPPSQKDGENGQCLTYVAMLIHKFTGRLAS